MKINNYKFWLPLFVIILTSLFLLTFRLNRDFLLDWDECVYAQYAKEMKQTQNFLYNTWEFQPNFEKPPLYAILQQPFLAFGNSEFYYRISSVIEGLLISVLLYILVYKYSSWKTASAATLLFLSSKILILIMTHVETDMGFGLFILLGFFFWILRKNYRFALYVSGLFFGLAVMHKGLSIVFFLMGIGGMIISTKDKRKFILDYLIMIGTLILVILPWHLFMWKKFGNPFLQEYFIDNLFTRSTHYLIPESSHILTHAYNLFVDYFPWHLLLLLPLFLKKKNRHPLLQASLPMFWIPFICFSLVKTRIASYMLPVIPFLALTIALYIDELLKNRKKTYFCLILFLYIEVVLTILIRTDFFRNTKINAADRYESFLQAHIVSSNAINHLVPLPHRNVHSYYKTTIPYHTRYGAFPCLVYYGEKKVNLYYDVEKFRRTIISDKNTRSYFLIENTDYDIIKDKKIKVEYKNNSYTIFSF